MTGWRRGQDFCGVVTVFISVKTNDTGKRRTNHKINDEICLGPYAESVASYQNYSDKGQRHGCGSRWLQLSFKPADLWARHKIRDVPRIVDLYLTNHGHALLQALARALEARFGGAQVQPPGGSEFGLWHALQIA